jgi:hypothetical protein
LQDAQASSTQNKYADLVEECGGLDLLESLQTHTNEEIYEKSLKILRTYFESEDDTDTNLAPVVDADAAAFTFGAVGTAPPADGFNFN